MKRYAVCSVLDITQPLLVHNEKNVPSVQKLVVKDPENKLEIKYLETEGVPIGKGSVIVCKTEKIIRMREISVEKHVEYTADKIMISTLLGTIKTQRQDKT